MKLEARCVYCGAPQREETERGKCRTGFPHCFHFAWSEYIAAQAEKEQARR